MYADVLPAEVVVFTFKALESPKFIGPRSAQDFLHVDRSTQMNLTVRCITVY